MFAAAQAAPVVAVELGDADAAVLHGEVERLTLEREGAQLRAELDGIAWLVDHRKRAT